MDSPLLPSSALAGVLSGHLRRRRRWRWILLAAAGISGYGAYRLYRHRRRLAALFDALFSFSDALSFSADAAALLSSDLHGFLRSDADEIPRSLRQIFKVAASDEFCGSVSSLSEALAVGVRRGIGSDRRRGAADAGAGFSDRAIDKLFSDSGTGFASVVVGSFARNLVLSYYSAGEITAGSSAESNTSGDPAWVRVIAGDECRALLADSIQRFVSTAVSVYLDKTMHINTYDELFVGLTNPSHETRVKEMLLTVSNGAVETLVRTSHQVLSSSSAVNGSESFRRPEGSGGENEGWTSQIATTLAVPSNRRFVLDATGRMTSETVRSLMEFFLMKLGDGASRSATAVRRETVERGLEVWRYFSSKSMVIYTITLALCMHVLTGTRMLMPA